MFLTFMYRTLWGTISRSISALCELRTWREQCGLWMKWNITVGGPREAAPLGKNGSSCYVLPRFCYMTPHLQPGGHYNICPTMHSLNLLYLLTRPTTPIFPTDYAVELKSAWSVTSRSIPPALILKVCRPVVRPVYIYIYCLCDRNDIYCPRSIKHQTTN